MVRDTPPSQDVSTNQIWNSYLKEYRRYGPDTKAGRTDGLTDGWTDSAITICLPKFHWGHKKVKLCDLHNSNLSLNHAYTCMCSVKQMCKL